MSAQTYTLINAIGPAAVQSCVNTGIYPSVLIAQAILESDSGRSTLASKFNNLFGHRASGSWIGATVNLGGKLWRAYSTILDGIRAHVEVLTGLKYRLTGTTTAKDPFTQAHDLQAAGYNADKSKYADLLGAIIKQYQLQKFDEQMFAIERQKNTNNLAFNQQGGLTKLLHSITG